MPEIGEVARVVHYLRKHLLSRKITKCIAEEDTIVYGKVGCSAAAFQSHVQSRVVTNVGQQGKYFYITFDKAPHAVLHLGMTGWVKFSTEDSRYYAQAKEKEREEKEEWPPTKWVKFLLGVEKEEGGEGREAVEAAFQDSRRLARIRLVDCEASEIRQHSPLKENGPDPVVDKDVFTKEWLSELLGKKRVPVKALLLDQANISGIGNWVADEVLYQARIHPEQYSNTFNEDQVGRLHDAITDVCGLAVSTLADSKQFPETWLMKYRWDKGKKDANVLPNGEKIVHLKVGGRTSAIVPSVQKKTAAVAGDVGEEDGDKGIGKGKKRKVKDEDQEADEDEEEEQRPAKKGGRGAKRGAAKAEDIDGADEKKGPAKNGTGRKGKKASKQEENVDEPVAEDANGGAEEDEEGSEEAKPVKKKTTVKPKTAPKQAKKPAAEGTRRSTRSKV